MAITPFGVLLFVPNLIGCVPITVALAAVGDCAANPKLCAAFLKARIPNLALSK
jgi:hypothetical protein